MKRFFRRLAGLKCPNCNEPLPLWVSWMLAGNVQIVDGYMPAGKCTKCDSVLRVKFGNALSFFFLVSIVLMFVPLVFLISQGKLEVLADSIASMAPIVSSEVAKFILCLIFVSFIAMPLSNRVLKLEVK